MGIPHILTDKDFEKAKTPATEAFDIRAFVSADDIDFLYFDTPYYLAPSGKADFTRPRKVGQYASLVLAFSFL